MITICDRSGCVDAASRAPWTLQVAAACADPPNLATKPRKETPRRLPVALERQMHCGRVDATLRVDLTETRQPVRAHGGHDVHVRATTGRTGIARHMLDEQAAQPPTAQPETRVETPIKM
jgi:hypothetical protein